MGTSNRNLAPVFCVGMGERDARKACLTMPSPRLIASACAAALLGAMTGASIATEPLERGIDAWDHLPQPDIDGEEADRLSEAKALPDHYPLVTPQGRFEVAELRDRGLYRNRRFAIDDYWIDSPEPAYELAADYEYIPADSYEPAPVRTAAEARAAARASLEASPQEAGPPVLAVAEAEPLAPPSVSRPPSLAGAPRVIDVSAELAARQ
jgi:hypothetical protein